MSNLLSAHISFGIGTESQQLQFHTTGGDNPWRFLADDDAVVLVPICDSLAQTVPKPPLCDRLEIWPVQHGFPRSLIDQHPDEVEQMRLDHYAGKHDLSNGSLPWDAWLNDMGIFQLWLRHRTPELVKQWLNCDNVISDGSTVFMLAGQSESNDFPKVRRSTIDDIRFRADFFLGEKLQTVYLAACIKTPLTTEERKLSPAHASREDKVIRKRTDIEETAAKNIVQGVAVAAQLQAAAKEVAKATQVADLYANPSIADAKNAAIKQNVPKEFVHHCVAEMHAKKFPSTDQAFRAVLSLPLFRELCAKKTPSRTSTWRWLSIVRKELEQRGLLQPRGKGHGFGKIAHYDTSKHPAPSAETISLEDAEQKQERGGRTDRNLGSLNSNDPQGYD